MSAGPGGHNQVVIFTGTKTVEHRGCFLRRDQRQISQEGENLFGGSSPGATKRPQHLRDGSACERSREAHRSLVHGGRKYSGCGVIEYDAELALIFPLNSRTLSAPVRAWLSNRHDGRNRRHVVANEVEVIAASPDESLELARNHGKHFQKWSVDSTSDRRSIRARG